MKYSKKRGFFLVFTLYFILPTFAQSLSGQFVDVDTFATKLDVENLDSLSLKLQRPFFTDMEKIRAIFSWITSHIEYDVYPSGGRQQSRVADTLPAGVEATELLARIVFHRRLAVCDGYAHLFKWLCDKASIECEIISGFAKGAPFSMVRRFGCNHSWNSVKANGQWFLIDVTWGSGYVSDNNRFVKALEEKYFCPPPHVFLQDHFPDDLRWTLLNHIPATKEFKKSPFLCKSFHRYDINSLSPSGGIVHAAEGDTIVFSFKARRTHNVAADPFLDLAIFGTPNCVFLTPSRKENEQFIYEYVVHKSFPEWIHLVLNGEPVIRYRFEIISKIFLTHNFSIPNQFRRFKLLL